MSRIQSIGIAALLSSLVISPTLAQKNTVRQGAQQLRQQLNATPGLSRGDAAKVMGAYYQGMGVTPPARFSPPPAYNSPPVFNAPRQAYPVQSPSYRQPSASSIPQYNLGNTSYPRQPAYGSHGVPPAGYVSGPGRTPAAGYGPGPANRLPTFSPGFTSATGTMPPSASPATQTFRYVDTAGQVRTINAGSANEALRTAPGIARTSGVELVSPSPSQVDAATAHRTPTFSPSFNSPGGFISATPPLQAGRPTFTPQPVRTAAEDKPNPSAAARPAYVQSGTGAQLTPEQVKSGTFTPGTFFVESGTGRQVPAHQVQSALAPVSRSTQIGTSAPLGMVPPPAPGRPTFSPTSPPGKIELAAETVRGLPAAAKEVGIGFAKGTGEALKDIWMGTISAAAHPIQTAKDIGHAAAHPIQTGKAVAGSVKEGAQNFRDALARGDGPAVGQTLGNVLTNAATAVVPGGSATRAISATAGTTRFGEATRLIISASEASGGHLIKRHVGLSDAQLAARLSSERIPAASTFLSRVEAEAAVAKVLDSNQSKIDDWLRSGAVGKLELNAPFVGGRVLDKSSRSFSSGNSATVILRGDSSGNFHVLTGYPVR